MSARIFSSRWGPIIAGAALGALAPLLVYYGNPRNMGLCVACFTRDTAGGLGMHSVAALQYIRPELVGLVLGALLSSMLYGEFKARTGSAPLARFTLGFFAMIGALVFLGCPWRAYLRLGSGDWNAAVGILGLTAGVCLGVAFLKAGFSFGRSRSSPRALACLTPLLMLGLLLLLLLGHRFGPVTQDGLASGPIFTTPTGTAEALKMPGAQRVWWVLALCAGGLIGFLAQRSRFCSVGAIRDLIILRDGHLFYGLVALVAAAAISNAALGQFSAGFEGQPIAHTNHLWNFGGMVLSGLAFTLAGGCPGRQLVLSGEGDSDAGVFILGMFAGAAFAHNFFLASSGSGPSGNGPGAVLIGILVCVLMGLTMREPVAA